MIIWNIKKTMIFDILDLVILLTRFLIKFARIELKYILIKWKIVILVILLNNVSYLIHWILLNIAFDIIHVDIFNLPSIHDRKIFLTLVDNHTKHTWIYLVKIKSEIQNILFDFVVFIKIQFDKILKL